MSDEVDFEALRATGRVKLAAGITGAAGLWTLLLANQSYHLIRFEGAYAVIISTKFLLALLLFACALALAKMRAWAVYGTLAVSVTTAVLGLGWLVFSFANSLISFMPLMVVPSAGAGAFLTFLAREDVTRAEVARERMRKGGMDLGM
jgi:hypothetical protein